MRKRGSFKEDKSRQTKTTTKLPKKKKKVCGEVGGKSMGRVGKKNASGKGAKSHSFMDDSSPLRGKTVQLGFTGATFGEKKAHGHGESLNHEPGRHKKRT